MRGLSLGCKRHATETNLSEIGGGEGRGGRGAQSSRVDERKKCVYKGRGRRQAVFIDGERTTAAIKAATAVKGGRTVGR